MTQHFKGIRSDVLQYDQLQEKFGPFVFFPQSESYSSSTGTYFSQQECSIAPACVIKPETAQQVAEIVAMIVADGTYKFAIKSQGNAPGAGSANIADGIVIEISSLNSVTTNEDHSVASVGAGAKWAEVYSALEPLDKTVAGGRIGAVGVGGLTLGGGISFFSPQVGFTCDTVTNFEIVLASGELVNANESSRPDLFRALKGGMNNFGVVTRIDFTTLSLPDGEVLGGLIINPWTERDAVFKAFSNITNNQNYDKHASLLTSAIFDSTAKSWMLLSAPVYTKPVRTPDIYKELFACPNIKDMVQVQKLSTMVNYPAMPKDNVLFFTATYGVTVDFLHEMFALAEPLLSKGPAGVKWIFALEPLPAATYEYGAGKNVLGTTGAAGNGFVFFLTASWADAALNDEADVTAQKLVGEIDALAMKNGLFQKFRYVNYADPSQDPFGSYGRENKEFLQRVSKEYDPNGVFQKMVPGGFKLWM